jgi:hypothetical protein
MEIRQGRIMPKQNPKNNLVHKQRAMQARPSQPRHSRAPGDSTFLAPFVAMERSFHDQLRGEVLGEQESGAGKARNEKKATRHRPTLFYSPPPSQLPRVFQLKITLRDLVPLVWRRILISDSATFKDLHRAIQKYIGWESYHLHEFRVLDPAIPGQVTWIQGLTNTIDDVEAAQDYDFKESDVTLRNFLAIGGNTLAFYDYDFGDSWSCRIRLERSLEPDLRIKYPTCIDGRRAGPPEDSGGTSGYLEKLAILKNARHPDHEETKDWLGDGFDPDACDCISKEHAKFHPEGSGFPPGHDDDIPAEILPIQIEFETLVNQGAKAYNKKAKDVTKAVDAWIAAWHLLSSHVPSTVHTIEEMDDRMLGLFPDFARFINDLHKILEEATSFDAKYTQDLARYREEVLQHFNFTIPLNPSTP